MTKLTLLTLTFLFFFPAPLSQVRNESPEVNILESVFRYEVARCMADRKVEMYFLSYRKQDPNGTLIATLASRGLRVKRRSEMSHLKDKDTGKRSIMVDVSHIELRGERRADVRASCYAGGLDGSSYSYRLVLSNRRWIVTRRKLIGFA